MKSPQKGRYWPQDMATLLLRQCLASWRWSSFDCRSSKAIVSGIEALDFPWICRLSVLRLSFSSGRAGTAGWVQFDANWWCGVGLIQTYFLDQLALVTIGGIMQSDSFDQGFSAASPPPAPNWTTG